MKISDLPNGLKELAIKRAYEDGGEKVGVTLISTGFTWAKTKEMYNFWRKVNGCKFDVYKKLYPTHEWIKDYPGEYCILDDNYLVNLNDAHEFSKFLSSPDTLANGYYAGENVGQEIKDAWKQGYSYANRMPTEHGPQPPTNEGIKESDGKTDYSEINFDILDLMAARFEANKHKYPKGNMLKPIDINSLLWPIFRHWKKMKFPIVDDVESFKDHLAAIMCNCSMILDQLKISELERLISFPTKEV